MSTKQGVYVVDRWVTQLSGPVSLLYLRPTEEHAELPRVMMLGDHHFEISGKCKSCTCHYSTESCCYLSYDPQFLQLLDHLSAPPRHNIHMYVEAFARMVQHRQLYAGQTDHILHNEPSALDNVDTYFPEMMDTKKYVGEPLPSMYAGNIFCFFQTGDQSAYRRFCPTRNMEWHFADARSALGRIDLDNVLKNKNLNRDMRFKSDFEFSCISVMEGMFVRLNEAMKTGENMKLSDRYLTEHANFIVAALMALFSKDVSKLALMLMQHQDSLVAKQAAKFATYRHLTLTQVTETIVKPYLAYLIQSNKFPMDHAELQRGCNDLAQMLRARVVKKKDHLRDTAALIKARLIELTSSMLDLYVFFRMYKAEPRSWLNILCAGDEHCKNFKHLLANIMGWYTLDEDVRGDERCLQLSGNIELNLNQEALAYGFVAPTEVDGTIFKDKQPRSFDIDTVRLSLLGKGVYNRVNKTGKMPQQQDLEEMYIDIKYGRGYTRPTSPIEVYIAELQLDEWQRDLDARRKLNDDSLDEQGIIPYIRQLCSTSSKSLQLKVDDLSKLVQRGWTKAIEECAAQSRNYAASLLHEVLQSEMDSPTLALRLYNQIQRYARPTTVDPTETNYVSDILYLLVEEARGRSTLPFDVFDAFYPVLSTFRGYFDQTKHRNIIAKLVEIHPKFGEAFKAGKLRFTLDPIYAPLRQL